MPRGPRTTLAALSLVLIASSALADEMDVCLAAHVRGQEARAASKLLEARDAFRTCARPICPPAAREDCGQWLAATDSTIPTIVIAARDEAGRDVLGVQVTIDGTRAAHHVDGRALELDPGPHRLRVVDRSGATVEREVVVRDGERQRRIEVVFPAAKPIESSTHPKAAKSEPESAIPTASYVLAGIGVVALASFGFFAYTGRKRHVELRESCAPKCSNDEKSEVSRAYLIGDISLGVAVVSFGAASWLALGSARPATGKQRFGVGVAGRF